MFWKIKLILADKYLKKTKVKQFRLHGVGGKCHSFVLVFS